MSGEEDLIDYSDEELQPTEGPTTTANGGAKKGDATGGNQAKGSYVGIHSTSFRDFLLKPELLKAITDCGFEHPSEVQQSTIPQAILGTDILAQAKSGLGKTAVFVLSTLQQLEPVDGEVSVLVLCHTRELAFQIRNEYLRFTKYMPAVKTAVFYGGTDIKENEKLLRDKDTHPHIIVATPGRLNALVREKKVRLGSVNKFVLDECDKMLEQVDMRRDVQEIFRNTPTQKQVMMFSATLSQQIRPVCKKFMQSPLEITADDGSEKVTLHGLQLYYVKLSEAEKNRRLNDLLDELNYNQVIIFVKSTVRATELDRLLRECNFPSVAVHSGVSQEERIKRYTAFKNYDKRICVSTDVFGRGIDFERINLVINYDMPETQSPGVSDKEILAMSADTYLHRVGRGGRFGTKAIAISFIANERDEQILQAVESRFARKVDEYPEGGKGISVEGKD